MVVLRGVGPFKIMVQRHRVLAVATKIRVLVIEDNRLVRERLAVLLDAHQGFKVVGA